MMEYPAELPKGPFVPQVFEAAWFHRDEKPEVWVVGWPAGPDGEIDKTRMDEREMIPLVFASLELAVQAQKILSVAFAEIEKLRREQAEDQATCAHKPQIVRFSRKLPATEVCVKCNATLRELTADEWQARNVA